MNQIDKIANIVLGSCVAADWFVAGLYAYEHRWYAAGYWLAAGVISFCAWRGLR